MALRLPPGTTTVVPATSAVHPVGSRVWLPREGRYGRVVVRVHGGLLYRVRLEGGGAWRLVERPPCELRAADENWAG